MHCSLHSQPQVAGDLEDYTRWTMGISSALKFMSFARKCPTMCAACSRFSVVT